MKKIILSLVVGLVAGYGVTNALESDQISKLHAENNKANQQLSKLSEQLLVLQKQKKQSLRIAQGQVVKRSAKSLTSNSLHKSKPTKPSQEQMYAQRKQAIEHITTQQKQQAQQSNNELKGSQVKTTENGTVL
ncbi:hypothetical protein CXF85_04340 [Colwellia sp. 75C3]|uniref:hypothetical protein n=1 Tax=Colwellia sp. 75C3 TaxID=888425 RepID=UPI000C3244AD|nr:hypothetical protein [Colwellia sp. 75C3]PKG86005.1 hypothetical protein CXF85_04340 [Colwellia sp. 75C3]